MLKSFIAFVLLIQSVFQPNLAYAASTPPPEDVVTSDDFMVQRELQPPKSGSVYITPSRKNEVLFKASVWGAVQNPGVHYLPMGTRMLDALSLAGGPTEKADIKNLTLSSPGQENGIRKLSLTDAFKTIDGNPILKSNDVLMIPEDKSNEKISIYLQIGTFIFSAIALGLIVERR